MTLGRLEVVGADGARAPYTGTIGSIVVRDGLSVGLLDLDHFLVRRAIGPLGSLFVRVACDRETPPAVPAPAPPPAPASTPSTTAPPRPSFGERMRKAREAKRAHTREQG